MKKVDRLRKELLEACKFRGHKMKSIGLNFAFGRVRQGYICQDCGKWAGFDTDPEPNGIEIGGEAVAVNCKEG